MAQRTLHFRQPGATPDQNVRGVRYHSAPAASAVERKEGGMKVTGCVWIVAAALASTAHAAGRDSCGDGDRGRLLRYERVASYPTAAATQAYFQAWIAFYQDYYQWPAQLPERFTHGFDSYKVTYCTVDALLPGQRKASPTSATGMVSIPRAPGPLPTVAYQHGTSVSFYDAPSNPNIVGPLSARGESFEGPPADAVFAGNGFIFVGADYLGLGDSSVPRERYFHAETEASAGADLLAAAREVLAELHVRQTGDLFIFGYSQGSHAAMALHRALQEAHVDVTATAIGGVILDVETWFLTGFTSQTVTLPVYMSLILLTYDDIYDVYDRKADVFRQPYAATVDGLFDMRHFWDDILAGLPPNGRELITRRYTMKLLTDPWDRLRLRLRQNAVDRWRPEAPVRVYQSTDDEEAPYQDVLESVARLRHAGADVTVQTLTGFDHINTWIQVLPSAVSWFRSLARR
jgi:hypothetical protein